MASFYKVKWKCGHLAFFKVRGAEENRERIAKLLAERKLCKRCFEATKHPTFNSLFTEEAK